MLSKGFYNCVYILLHVTILKHTSSSFIHVHSDGPVRLSTLTTKSFIAFYVLVFPYFRSHFEYFQHVFSQMPVCLQLHICVYCMCECCRSLAFTVLAELVKYLPLGLTILLLCLSGFIFLLLCKTYLSCAIAAGYTRAGQEYILFLL